MTTPAWNQPSAAQPARRKPWKKIGIGVGALLALCCGGSVLIGINTDPPAKGHAGGTSTVAPLAAPAVSATSSLAEPEVTSAEPTRTPAKVTPTPTRTKVRAAVPKPKPKVTTRKATPKPTRTKTTQAASRSGVHPGAFCSPVGARGTTSKGTAMRCTRKAGEERARWRAA